MTKNNNDRDNGSRRGPLIGLAAVVVIFVIGWLLARELYTTGKLEVLLSVRPHELRADRSPGAVNNSTVRPKSR